MKLIIASHNQKKRREIETILADLNIELVAAADTVFVEVIEDADSFAGNAQKKAAAFAAANQLPALADDSGLCVDALNGSPGIYSARYAGPDATDSDNNQKLLQALAKQQHRSASFFCAIHIAFPGTDTAITATGSVAGEILPHAAGCTGFGYDPLFFCPELGKTFAEATAAEKASVSHRGRALRALAAQLQSMPARC